jgi:hypothetical protein
MVSRAGRPAGAGGGGEVLAFDCAGAGAAGMRTAGVNRSAAPFDTIGAQPDLVVPGLDRLPAALGG